MCLTTNFFPKIKTAEEDIICYKVVQINEDGEMVTPFQEMKIQFDKEYTENLFETGIWLVKEQASRSYICSSTTTGDYRFNAYMFHTFADEREAAFFAEVVNSEHPQMHCVVINAIIPKGSEYIEGDFGYAYFNEGDWDRTTFKSFGSEKIIYKS